MSGTAGGPRHESLAGAVALLDPLGTPSGNLPVTPNFVLGLSTLIAAAALPGAGAFATGDASVMPGTKRVTTWITYTRGAAGGYPAIRAWSKPMPSASVPAPGFYRVPILDLASFAPAAPEGRENFYLEELLGPIPADGNPINYELTWVLPANAAIFRLQLAERGVVGTPGTVAVLWTGDG